MDQALLKKILEAPSSTPNVSLYLEFIIKARRSMFLQTIWKEEFTTVQILHGSARRTFKGDWSLQVAKDLEEINLILAPEEIIYLLVEYFRTKVRKAINLAAFQYLLNAKMSKFKVIFKFCYIDCAN